ncbi:hypothetical protein SCALM49S_04082 [Streptomyces californicus]
MADGGGGRGEPQLALLRAVESGEQAQQGGLARAVDSDETDHISRGDDEVEPGEERAVAVSGGEVLGDESGSHQGADSKGCPAIPRRPSSPPDGRTGQGGRRADGQLKRSSVISASCGLPSWTSDSWAPTSSKAKPYALPSIICAWMCRE